jgi:hypothetical protein
MSNPLQRENALTKKQKKALYTVLAQKLKYQMKKHNGKR